MHYFIRQPDFPLLGNIDGQVIGVCDEEELITRLSQLTLDMTPTKHYDFIDVAGTNYAFYPDTMMITPLTSQQRRWSKLALIRMVNSRTNTIPGEKLYTESSFGAKRFEGVFRELIEHCRKGA